jgi:hypothetical protein
MRGGYQKAFVVQPKEVIYTALQNSRSLADYQSAIQPRKLSGRYVAVE